MIQVVLFAVGKYIGYYENFLKTFSFFFPEEEKRLSVHSDSFLIDKQFKISPKIWVEEKYFPNLIYPTLNVNKPFLFNQFLEEDADYAFIIDCDTIFMNKPEYDWNNLKLIMDDGNVLLTKHPFYSLTEDETVWNLSKKEVIENLYTENLTEKDKRFSSYISDKKYTYINSAFWGGKHDAVHSFNDEIIKLTQNDLVRYPLGWHIPKYMDENYVNKIYSLYQKNNEAFSFKCFADAFSVMNGLKNISPKTVFMFQKGFNTNLKAYT